jgi:CheY-like chemotaxis protein
MTDTAAPVTTRTILIVDDDQGTRSGLQRFFERANYRVIAVSTFNDGRRALADAQPDILIADVRLGEYNGLQLVATNPRIIPAIIVTGYPDPVLEADARRFGADYLLKPVSPGALLAMVKDKLAAAIDPERQFNPGRRWPRKRVDGRLPALIADRTARIIDVSEGGLRFELERQSAHALPSTFAVTMADVSVLVDLVWTAPNQEDSWICGAAIAAGQDAAALSWQRVVGQY